MKKTFIITIVGFLSGILGAYTFHQLHTVSSTTPKGTLLTHTDFSRALFAKNKGGQHRYGRTMKEAALEDNGDFVVASETSTNSVVFIKNISEKNYRRNYFDWFFDGGGSSGVQEEVSSGSGVIFSEDGYIVTNNHVISEANRLEVVHNKKTYKATLIGKDPSTDLAVLKIEAKKLPAIKIGSSKTLHVGEWVLAVGNPFNLTSTVTAGIVSAKGRNINILEGKFPIESFIQTDAAINPGNSGGALVNKKGELVGINTAILSRTGSYAGYGFAVPVDIVRKIVNDLIRYGEVQKAFFGGEVYDIDSDLVERLELKVDDNDLSGVLLGYLQKDGPANTAGLEEGDILTAIDDEPINSKSEFDEIIGYHTPGDKVSITFRRNNRTVSKPLVLTNREGTTKILKRAVYSSKSLGANLEVVPKVERDYLNIESGVRISNIQRGLIRQMQISEGFIVTSINNERIDSPEEFIKILESIRGRVLIRGVSKDGVRGYYNFYF